jgi:hypothetical protein
LVFDRFQFLYISNRSERPAAMPNADAKKTHHCPDCKKTYKGPRCKGCQVICYHERHAAHPWTHTMREGCDSCRKILKREETKRIADRKIAKAAREKAERDANAWENRKPGRKDEEPGYQGKGKGRAMN